MGNSGNGKEETKRAGLPVQGGSQGNLRSAGSDEQLKQTLDSVKSSKSPVS
jgi:thioredoxin 1